MWKLTSERSEAKLCGPYENTEIIKKFHGAWLEAFILTGSQRGAGSASEDWEYPAPKKGTALAVWWEGLKPGGGGPELDWQGYLSYNVSRPIPFCLTYYTLFESILWSLEIFLQQSLGNQSFFKWSN